VALRLEEAATGTPADFEAFYAEYAPRVRAYIRRRVRVGQSVDDLVQETFLRAHRNAASFDASRPAWPWLVTIASNLIIDASRLRSAQNETPVELTILDGSQPGADPADHFHGSQRRDAISRVLRSLPARQRRVLVLRELDGLRYDAVAEHEGLTVDAVKALLKRARTTFRESYSTLAAERGLWAIGLLPLHFLRRAVTRFGPRLNAIADLGAAPIAAALVATAIGVSGMVSSSPRLGGATSTRAALAGVRASSRVGEHAARAGGQGAMGASSSGRASSTTPGGPLGDSAKAGIGNHIDATGEHLKQGDHENITLFGIELYDHEGTIGTDCRKNALREQLCALIGLLPQDIGVGDPQPTPTPDDPPSNGLNPL
jgi:RNA polymerase sigma-70 factor (ECF subfamily)